MGKLLDLKNLSLYQNNQLITTDFNLNIVSGQIYPLIYNTKNEELKNVFRYLLGIRGTVEGDITKSLQENSAFLPRDGGYYPDLTGRQQLEYLTSLFPKFSQEKAEELIHRLELPIDKKIKEFTDMKARLLLLAGVLATNDNMILLEAPFYNLAGDLSSQLEEIFKEEADRGRAILFTLRDRNKELVDFHPKYLLTETGIEPQEKTQKENNGTKKKFVHKIPVWKKDREKALLIDQNDIKWISTHKGKSTLHTTNGAYEVNLLLRELEDRLVSPPFFRCHRSYIVNLEYIEEVITWFNGTYNLKVGKEEIPVSRSKADKLEKMIGI